MCYSGKCKYEHYPSGDCILNMIDVSDIKNLMGSYPDDALCVLADKYIEESEKLRGNYDNN